MPPLPEVRAVFSGVAAWPIVTLFVVACTSGDREAGAGTATLEAGSLCPRPDPVAFSPGEVVTIPDGDVPCRIVFRETGIALRSDPNGTHPDPGQRIVRDIKGRFYTAGAQGFPFDIALWDADGTFLRSVGSAGTDRESWEPRARSC